MNQRKILVFMSLLLVVAALACGVGQAQAAPILNPAVDLGRPNFAYSPTTIKKFVDSLPGVNTPNNLLQQIPLAAAGTFPGFPNDDYYEIGLVEYFEQMHTNLPASGTKLRGYVQLVPSGTPGAVALTTANGLSMNVLDSLGNPVFGAAKPHYLGPLILATKNRPVRIKFSNLLPVGTVGAVNGKLFLPVDTDLMGAGMGPKFSNGSDCDPATQACARYTENRATIHLHGGIPPWISDGTAHQWITPAGEVGLTPFLKGASQQNVPDMWFNPTTHVAVAAGTPGATNDPGPGSATFYWTNQQSGRLMFYHDHALGITGLNVYAGEAAGYLLVDPAEETPLNTAGVPGTIVTNPATGAIVSHDLPHLIPLVIQDKTFVPSTLTLPSADPLNTDPLWDTVNWGGVGSLWFPHVYMPNQDNTDLSGANPLGRWDYGPWFWPVFPVDSPYPPTVSHVPEAFMDTPVVNGTAYPHVNVNPAIYRLRILNACNDRMVNLQLYQADPAGHAIDLNGNDIAPGPGAFGTEVKMVPATPRLACGAAGAPAQPDCVCTALVTTNCFPEAWTAGTPGMIPDILDSRPSGVPDPTLRGPAMIQIGTEGGILPGPVLHLNTPVGFEQNKRNIVVLNVLEKTLFMAPAERADVIVDFSKFAGKTVILYNDSPAPVPASDPRYDFYTGNPDYSATAGASNQGGAPSTVAGFGPNTRTIVQFRVGPGTDSTAPVDDYDASPTGLLAKLQNPATGLPAIFKTTQDAPVVPESVYNAIGYTGGATTDTFARIQDLSLTFTPYGSNTASTMQMKNPTIQELFDPQGRMNATLGVELPFTGALIQTTVPLGFKDPTTEILGRNQTQLWKITHNGVDTHGIHFHLVNVQVINRVGWDGAVRETDPNELGWKDTVRMNPLEDIIVAMRAKTPTFPFTVPNSVRPLDPTMPVGTTFGSLDPQTGTPITVTNKMYNFGWEYTWHCHILGHEENDMMRALVVRRRPPADFDGDKKTDLAVYRASTGAWIVSPSSGAAAYAVGWGGPGFAPVPGDYDGDGKTDLGIYNTASGAWWIIPSSGAAAYGIGWGGAGFTPILGDFDGDGRTDVAIYQVSTGAWWIIPSSGAPAYGIGWGGAGFTPILGDFDGDGKTDIAIYQASAGAWWIIPSSGAPAYGVGWGGPSFTPVPGDYDGDGKTDIAIYQASAGAWWIKPSSGAAAYGVGWGGDATDIPVPGDYDRDGIADVAVYRANTGTWYVIPSSGAAAYGIGWGGDASDVPIAEATQF